MNQSGEGLFSKTGRVLKIGVPVVAVLVIFSLFQNCGKDSGGSSSSGLSATTATFRLNNHTGLNIDLVYISPSSSPTWGDNLLSSPLPDGAGRDFTGYSPDTYDGMSVIVGVYSLYSAYSFGVPVNAGQVYTVDSQAADFSGSLKVVNNSLTRTITAIYVSPHSTPTWGPNQLSGSLAPGQSMHFYDLAPDNYDILVTWNSGADSIYINVNVSSLALTNQGAN